MKRVSLGAKIIAANAVLMLLIAVAIVTTVLFNASHLQPDIRTNMILLSLGAFAFTVGIGIFLFVRWQVRRPLNDIIGAMLTLADGKTDREPPHLDRVDEVGRMARAIEVFRVNAI
jgi:methyl-accepting chemotaxis protein